MSSLTVATHAARGSDHQAIARELIDGLKRRLGRIEPALIMLFASIEKPLAKIQPLVHSAFSESTVLGSSTAGEFTEAGDTQGEIVAWAIGGDIAIEAKLGTGLKGNLGVVEEVVAALPTKHPDYAFTMGLILLDPLAGNAEEATLTASALLGGDVRLVGGAAADNMAMAATYVGLNNKVCPDSIILAMIYTKKPLGVGVCHGHKPLSVPLTVTKAESNVVYEIEGKPAWDVWLEQTAEQAKALGIDGKKLSTSSEVFDFLNRFEAGLSLGNDYKVRVPLARGEDGSIEFACGIPEGTVLRIMESEEERQIASAGDAVRRSLSSLGSDKAAGALVFDCSCRKTILKGRFREAVGAMREALDGAPVAGFETYGEVAMEIGEFSGFHNTTTVAVTFPA